MPRLRLLSTKKLVLLFQQFAQRGFVLFGLFLFLNHNFFGRRRTDALAGEFFYRGDCAELLQFFLPWHRYTMEV